MYEAVPKSKHAHRALQSCVVVSHIQKLSYLDHLLCCQNIVGFILHLSQARTPHKTCVTFDESQQTWRQLRVCKSSGLAYLSHKLLGCYDSWTGPQHVADCNNELVLICHLAQSLQGDCKVGIAGSNIAFSVTNHGQNVCRFPTLSGVWIFMQLAAKVRQVDVRTEGLRTCSQYQCLAQ